MKRRGLESWGLWQYLNISSAPVRWNDSIRTKNGAVAPLMHARSFMSNLCVWSIMQVGSRTRQMLVESTFGNLEVWALALALIILCQRCGASNSPGQQVCMFRPCSVPVRRDSIHWEVSTVTAGRSQIDCYDFSDWEFYHRSNRLSGQSAIPRTSIIRRGTGVHIRCMITNQR